MAGDFIDRHVSIRIILALGITLLTLLVMQQAGAIIATFGDVILIFFLAWALSFLLRPVVLWLTAHRVKRAAAVVLVYSVLTALLIVGVVFAVPVTAQEGVRVFAELNTLFSAKNATGLNTLLTHALEQAGMAPADATNVSSQLTGKIPEWSKQLENALFSVPQSLVAPVFSVFTDIILIIVISGYMLSHGPQLFERTLAQLPPLWARDMRTFQQNTVRIFGGFFRTQLSLAAMYALITYLLLFFVGQPNSLFVAVLTGLLLIVPIVGPVISVFPSLALIWLQQQPGGTPVVSTLEVLVVLLVTQQVILQVLAPKLMGDSLGVNPVLLFAALFIGLKWAGVWGAFFAAPMAALAQAVGATYWDRAKLRWRAFLDPAPLAEEAARAPESSKSHGEIIIPSAGESSAHIPTPRYANGSLNVGDSPEPPAAAAQPG
ncbi:MAG TPA: AI-2E family transporter [Ktedonobacterales bacterium]